MDREDELAMGAAMSIAVELNQTVEGREDRPLRLKALEEPAAIGPHTRNMAIRLSRCRR